MASISERSNILRRLAVGRSALSADMAFAAALLYWKSGIFPKRFAGY